MKYLPFIILSLLLISSKTVQGQYEPMVEEGKYWIYMNYFISGDNFLPVSGHAITFQGDTVINSVTYRKVYRLELKGYHNCPWPPCWQFNYPYQTESTSLVSLIREDTLQKKVYNLPLLGWGFCDTVEHLIFDYSLMVGDTINSCIYDFILASYVIETPAGVVDSIGARELFGKSRNTLYTTGFLPFGQDIFVQQIPIVEGVGLEWAGIFLDPLSFLVDFCEDSMSPCQLLSSNSNIENVKPVNLFPNPTQGLLRISAEDEEVKSISVYSMTGVLIYEVMNTDSLELDNLQEGIYLIEIVLESGGRIIRKVVKE